MEHGERVQRELGVQGLTPAEAARLLQAIDAAGLKLVSADPRKAAPTIGTVEAQRRAIDGVKGGYVVTVDVAGHTACWVEFERKGELERMPMRLGAPRA